MGVGDGVHWMLRHLPSTTRYRQQDKLSNPPDALRTLHHLAVWASLPRKPPHVLHGTAVGPSEVRVGFGPSPEPVESAGAVLRRPSYVRRDEALLLRAKNRRQLTLLALADVLGRRPRDFRVADEEIARVVEHVQAVVGALSGLKKNEIDVSICSSRVNELLQREKIHKLIKYFIVIIE
jgi:hypothetical protein